jgi:hypothetical protein
MASGPCGMREGKVLNQHQKRDWMPLALKKVLRSTVGRALGCWSPAENIEGWMSRDELRWLRQQAKKRHVIIEIGSWKGRSTYELASATPGILFFVEHFQGSHDGGHGAYEAFNSLAGMNAIRQTLLDNLDRFVSQGRALLVEMNSADAAQALAPILRHRGADMIFIDGDHSYEGAKGDILSWQPFLHPGGLLCGHDSDWPEVRQALDEVLPGWQHGPGSIWHYPVRRV